MYSCSLKNYKLKSKDGLRKPLILASAWYVTCMTLNFTVAELFSKINWALAAVATFAFYQFVEPCSSRDLIAFGAAEFIIIMLILVVVTTLIVRTANKE